MRSINFLTPQGLEQKARITLKFLKAKITEYERIKEQINELTNDLGTDHPDVTGLDRVTPKSCNRELNVGFA